MSAAAIVSFRLGGGDGVGVEASKWQGGLERLGFTVRRIAGQLEGGSRPGDVVIPGLGLPDGQEAGGRCPPAPTRVELRRALAGAELVVVENLLSLPLNPAAADVVENVLADLGVPTVLHHHDLPWQRAATARVANFPPDFAGAQHVTINDRSRHELAERRQIEATTIRNCFDLDAPLGDRARGRAVISAGPDDVVVLHPVRAIPRKDVPAAVKLCEQLADRLTGRVVRYWLPGPAEEGYGPILDKVLANASGCFVHREPAPDIVDAYAACDLVAFPSQWEGFGNPIVESVVARRPLAVARYPVLEELLAEGFRFVDSTDPDAVAAAVVDPDADMLDANADVARRYHSLAALDRQLAALLRGSRP